VERLSLPVLVAGSKTNQSVILDLSASPSTSPSSNTTTPFAGEVGGGGEGGGGGSIYITTMAGGEGFTLQLQKLIVGMTSGQWALHAHMKWLPSMRLKIYALRPYTTYQVRVRYGGNKLLNLFSVVMCAYGKVKKTPFSLFVHLLMQRCCL